MGAKTHGKSSEFAARTERRKRTENRGPGRRKEGKGGGVGRKRWRRRRKSSAKHHSSGSDTRFSHREQAVPFFFWGGERRESTPTLFRDWGNFSNYPVLKWRAIGSIFFPFFSTYGCSSTREFEGVDRGVEGEIRASLEDITRSTVYICLSISRKGDGWMELQFCGRRQRAGRTQPL